LHQHFFQDAAAGKSQGDLRGRDNRAGASGRDGDISLPDKGGLNLRFFLGRFCRVIFL
jgi:hypothetical protein